MKQAGLKDKDLVGIPWMVAFALRESGWWLRAENIWHKPNPMVESVTDRTTRAHEHLFLLSVSERYFYDAEAIAEPAVSVDRPRGTSPQDRRSYDWHQPYRPGPQYSPHQPHRPGRSGNKIRRLSVPTRPNDHRGSSVPWEGFTRNKRSVWTVSVAVEPELEHYGKMPQDLAEPCVLAGSRPGDTVLDPFCGVGTTGVVALRHGRAFYGIELSPHYVQRAHRRIAGPLFVGSNTPPETPPPPGPVASLDDPRAGLEDT